MTPTQRTLKALRDLGYVCAVVERWNSWVKRGGEGAKRQYGVRQDLFHIIDILALTPDGVLGVQTTGQGLSDHVKKLTVEYVDNTLTWLRTPGTQLQIWAWRKVKPRGASRITCQPRIVDLRLTDGVLMMRERPSSVYSVIWDTNVQRTD